MAPPTCPLCGCNRFYVKHPDDPYETCAFECRGDGIVFTEPSDADESIEIVENTETFCDHCSWHGKFGELKR